LAQEFRAIGDATGAKMLANEVLSQATGNLKTRAETFLAEVG
jgi:pilus assembly protein FimV